MLTLGLLGLPWASWGVLGILGSPEGLLGPPGGSWGLLEPPGASWSLMGPPSTRLTTRSNQIIAGFLTRKQKTSDSGVSEKPPIHPLIHSSTQTCTHPSEGPAADGPKMAPRWPQDGPKMAPRLLQDGPKMAPRWPQDGPKMALREKTEGLLRRYYI